MLSERHKPTSGTYNLLLTPDNPRNLVPPGRGLKIPSPSKMNSIFPHSWFLFETTGLLPTCGDPFSVTFCPSVSRREREAMFLVAPGILHGTAQTKKEKSVLKIPVEYTHMEE
jgi:hypothetical protein